MIDNLGDNFCMDKVCFFCTTPFQIITAIYLTMTEEKSSDVDLYVIDQFMNAGEVASKIRELEVFHDVILVKQNDIINVKNSSKVFIWSHIMAAYLVIDRKVKKILQKNIGTHYCRMYISSKTLDSRLVALYFAKEKEDTEIIYFDDGLGSYFNRKIWSPRFLDKIFRIVLFGKKAHNIDPKKILLYSPDLFYKAGTNVTEGIIVEAIPKWDYISKSKLKEISNIIFSYSEKDLIKESIIIFDGIYEESEKKKLDNFYKEIVSLAKPENVIIKKHPRDKSEDELDLKYYKRTDIPFELICLNAYMENKLLVAVATTAVISPLLLLGEEPYILIINNIPGLTNNHVNAQYDIFKEIYSNKEKFYIADSIESALGFIKKFMNFKC